MTTPCFYQTDSASLKVKRSVTQEDILNPDLARSQIESCIWQALGDIPLNVRPAPPEDFVPKGVSLRHYVACDGMPPEECREFRSKKRLIDAMGHTPIAPTGPEVRCSTHTTFKDNICTMLDVVQMLYKCVVFAGIQLGNDALVLFIIPAHKRSWTNVDLTLVQRRRRWTNVKSTLV